MKRWLALAAILCVSLGAGAATDPERSTAPSAAGEPASAGQEIPRSVFEIPSSPGEGLDPFFPKSTRLFGQRASRTNAAPAVRVSLALRGLAGVPGNRLATLTTRDNPPRSLVLAEGETGTLKTAAGEVRIRCVQIEDDRVLVEINGIRQELRLRDGL